MNELLGTLGSTPLPTILVVAGIMFWILAIAGSVAGKITLEPGKQRTAGLAGTAFIVLGLILFFAPSPIDKNGSKTTAKTTQTCIPGYVWREATPEDHVCVTMRTHEQTLQDNMLAGSRRNPKGGPYGADTCLEGFVWRDVFEGDHVCVIPETRSQVLKDDREGPDRIVR